MSETLIIAQSTAADLQKLREGFLARPDTVEQLKFWGWVLAFLMLVWIAVVAARRKPKRVKRIDLLTVAVDVLGLSESDRRTLLRIADRARLSEPASMLLSPANLAHAVASARACGGVPGLDETAARLSVELFQS